MRPRASYGEPQWMLWTLVSLASASLLSSLLPFLPLREVLGLSLQNLSIGRVWTCLTYAWVHDGLLHLLLNLLGIYFAGFRVADLYGQRAALFVFLSGVVVAGLGWSLLYALAGQHLNAGVLGASGGVMALSMVLLLSVWGQTVTFFLYVIPVQILANHLLVGLIGFDALFFLFREMPSFWGADSSTGVSHSLHLLGAGSGFLVFSTLGSSSSKGFLRRMLDSFLSHATALRNRLFRQRFRVLPPLSGKNVAPSSDSVTRPVPSPFPTEEEINRILDKIYSQGFDSITPQERATLDRAQTKFRK